MNFLLDSTLKVSLIVLVALGALVLLGRRSAALRHWVLAVAIACAAAAPLVGLVLPSWPWRAGGLPAVWQAERPGVAGTATVQLRSVPVGEAVSGTSVLALAQQAASTELPWPATLERIWMAGAGLSLLLVIVGLVRLKWLASGARRVERGRWVDLTAEISGEFGLRRPVALLQSDHPSLLVTWGLRRPKVALPATASEWAEDRVRIVLRHELAHIRRGDWIVQLASEVLWSVFWFNPLVWIACSRLRQESEYACDDAVLEGGVDGADYAAHLLDLARTLNAKRRTGVAALAMARPSSLEGRVSAMLNADVNRQPLSRWSRLLTILALVSLTVPIAGLSAQGTFVTVSGTVVDGTSRILPNVTLVLTNSGNDAKHEVRSDSTGRFEFVGVPAGQYVLEAKELGFATFRDTLTVTGQNINRQIELQLGSLTETVTVTDQSVQKPTPSQVERAQEARQRGQDKLQRALAQCTTTGAGPVGGNILVPTKLVDVKPAYPENLKDAKVGGVVVLDALIGADGQVADVQAVKSPDPNLENAAMEAVRQWVFSSTLLNCTPTDVHMRVLVNFAIQP